MTINDGWLVERALRLKEKRVQANKNSAVVKSLPKTGSALDDLWSQLQKETKRLAKVYTDALGDPDAVTVETTSNQIRVSVPDGRGTTLTFDRERGRLSESLRNAAGAVRTRKPIIAFSVNDEGEAAFNFGGLEGAAGSLLRRLVG